MKIFYVTNSHMQEKTVTMRAIVALRMARAALGWSQQEVADLLAMAKTTLARFETMEGGLNATQLSGLVKLYHDHGVSLEFMTSEDVAVTADPMAVGYAFSRLEDEALRRSDRRKPKGLIERASADEKSLVSEEKPLKINDIRKT